MPKEYVGNLFLISLIIATKMFAGPDLVRFPNSLAFGSELGLHYPYRRGIFLLGPTTQPIVDENGQLGAYWIRPHLLEPHAPSHFCSLTGFVTGTPCSSSTRK